MKRALRRPLRGQGEAVKRAARRLLAELRIARRSRAATRQFEALRGRQDLRVHLGCGDDIRSGWVNIDLFDGGRKSSTPAPRPQTIIISHDLRLGLPLEDSSCELIYSSHFFEHLSFADGARLMRDSCRALRRGGVFRAALPDFRADFEAYLRGDESFFAPLDEHGLMRGFDPRHRTFVDYLNYCVYQYGEHVAIYDQQKMIRVLLDVGFEKATESGFRPDLDPHSDLRRRYSFYVEAVK